MEWVRFWIVAILFVISLICFTSAVLGVWRFGYMMNRIHAGGIGDSLGVLCALLAIMIGKGEFMDILKLLLMGLFMWFTSPVATHFLSQIEYYSNPAKGRFAKEDLDERD